MKKILVIFLVLIALAIIGWLAAYKIKAPAIEADIRNRVNEALASNNLGWVNTSVDGRDVTLSGTAQTVQLHQYALRTASIEGVNLLKDGIVIQSKAAVVEKTVAAPINQVAPAYPYAMNILRDDRGQYAFTGIVPDASFKDGIEKHLASIGADPAQAVWKVDISSSPPPVDWEKHIKNSTSALQTLTQGKVNFANGKATIQGVAASQNASDEAERYAQMLAGHYTTDVMFNIVEKVATVQKATPVVGSAKFAALSCQTEFNKLLRNQKIQFESGSSTLQESSLSLLRSITNASGKCPDQSISVNGYTDSNGSAAGNKALSKKRAEAVKQQLVALGINPARLKARGYGEARPIASNRTEKGRAKNRRIELIVRGLR